MGHNLAGSPADTHREHPRRGCIDQPQANPVAAPDRVPGEQGPGDVAHAPGMGEVVPVAETLVQFAAAFKAPVVENDRNVTVDGGRVRLLDDQGAVETPGDLFPGPVVGVVPVGAGMGDVERIVEGAARFDRRLRQARHPVHDVVDMNAMPVDRGELPRSILEGNGHPVSLAGAKFGSGGRSVEAEHAGNAVALGKDPGSGGRGFQPDDRRRPAGRGDEGDRGRGCEKLSPVHGLPPDGKSGTVVSTAVAMRTKQTAVHSPAIERRRSTAAIRPPFLMAGTKRSLLAAAAAGRQATAPILASSVRP